MDPFLPKFTITNRITSAITQIERARGFLEAADLSESWLREMQDDAALLEAYYTTRIEGTVLTFAEASRLWHGGKVPEAGKEDVREFLNFRKAYDFVSESLERGVPVTEGMIRNIHKLLVDGVRGNSADPGSYRRIQNYVVNAATNKIIYTPPSAADLPEMMNELVKWLNADTEIHPLLVSGIAQFQLVHIHPFLDGNGRTSRLLSSICLYRSGYDFKRLFNISEYYDRDRSAFYKAIQSVRENDMDITGWLEYFLAGLEAQVLEVKERGERAIRMDVLRDTHNLNARQTSVLYYLISRETINIGSYENRFPNITRRTLQRDLNKLVEIGLLKLTGSARQSSYHLVK